MGNGSRLILQAWIGIRFGSCTVIHIWTCVGTHTDIMNQLHCRIRCGKVDWYNRKISFLWNLVFQLHQWCEMLVKNVMATEGLAFGWKLGTISMLMTLKQRDICSSLVLGYISQSILSNFITLVLNDLRFTHFILILFKWFSYKIFIGF